MMNKKILLPFAIGMIFCFHSVWAMQKPEKVAEGVYGGVLKSGLGVTKKVCDDLYGSCKSKCIANKYDNGRQEVCIKSCDAWNEMCGKSSTK